MQTGQTGKHGDGSGKSAVDLSTLRISGMSDELFGKFSDFIETCAGIKMPPTKKTMLEGRLRKRLRTLGYSSYAEYARYVFGGGQQEITHMLDVVTTNKTDFFREPAHFDFLVNRVLPEFMAREGHLSRAEMNVWSAGCSTGEEPYTLAMVLNEFAEANPRFRYTIYATDLSTRVLERATAGIYEMEKIAPVTESRRKKYLLRGTGEKKNLVRVVPELRAKVRFGRLNFMDRTISMPCKMHVIFCRNVIIYFDRDRQEQLLNKFCGLMQPEGTLFLGHSETLSGLSLPLAQIAPTVYRLTKG